MNISPWKDTILPYGISSLTIKIPSYCDILQMKYVPAVADPRGTIEKALSNPIQSPDLKSIIASRGKDPSRLTVAIAVSDDTRPVPYSGEKEEGILLPLLRRLDKAGIKAKNIKIIVALGTHQPTSEKWKEKAFGMFIKNNYEIIDHNCFSPNLGCLGRIEGVPVKINRQFLEADVHIITGLVEPHFMAGASGGRKAICPGLVNLETTHVFHGVDFMDNPRATNLVLEGNPCHRFALKVAHQARVDFSLNITLNGQEQLTGVFAGDLEEAHFKAVEKMRENCVIPVNNEYDLVLTQGGSMAVNHYQAAKAAYGVIPIIKRGGMVILVAHNSAEEAVGKDEYQKVINVLNDKGPGKFTKFIKSTSWQFIPDQWEVQKWDQFFSKIGAFDRLIYCTTNITPEDLQKLPGRSGYDFVEDEEIDAAKMVQKALLCALEEVTQKVKREPTLALVREGPYAVPLLRGQ